MTDTLKIEDINALEINTAIYGELETDDLEASITDEGLLNPIIVADTPQGFYVVSGNRRLQAMKNLGFEEIPVQYSSAATMEDIITEMVTHNLYRVKTNEVLLREGLALEKVENEKAKDRMGHNADKAGAVRDIIGEKLGMSGKTFAEGRKVIEEIDRLSDSDPESAEELRRYLDMGVHTALRALKEEDPKPRKEKEEDTPQVSKYNYWPTLKKAIDALEAAYKKLKPTRDHTAIPGYGDMVGNLMDMRDRLNTWDPAFVEREGTGLSKPSEY